MRSCAYFPSRPTCRKESNGEKTAKIYNLRIQYTTLHISFQVFHPKCAKMSGLHKAVLLSRTYLNFMSLSYGKFLCFLCIFFDPVSVVLYNFRHGISYVFLHIATKGRPGAVYLRFSYAFAPVFIISQLFSTPSAPCRLVSNTKFLSRA